MNRQWRLLKRLVAILVLTLLYMIYVKTVEEFYALLRMDSFRCSVLSQSFQNFTNHYHNHSHPVVFDINRINFTRSGRVCPEKNKTFLTICIISSPKNFEARNVIRQTWASVAMKNAHVNYVFILGKSHIPEINLKVLEESSKKKDIVIIDYFDFYRNLSYKSIAMLRWASIFCSKSKFIMKIDDDIFVDLRVLFNILVTMTAPKIIIGYSLKRSSPTRNKKSKWFVSLKDYSGKFYPDYISGLSYVISSDLLNDLLTAASKSHVLPVEDVYVTGICGMQAGATLIGNCGFHHMFIPIEMWAKNSVNFFAHHYSPNDMKAVWEMRTQIITNGSKWLLHLSHLLM